MRAKKFLKNEYMNTLKYTIFLIHFLLITLMAIPVLSQKLTLWWLDNLINLQLQLSLAAILLVLLSIKYIQYLFIPLSLIYFVIILYNFGPLYKPNHQKHQNKETLKIAQLNIKYKNPNIDNIISAIGDADYDVILIQEVGDGEIDKIKKLTEYYPYSIGTDPLDESGLALFSRWPIVSKKIHDLGYADGIVIEAVIHTPEKNTPVHIYALHPSAPRNELLWHLRNNTLTYVASQVSGSSLQYKIVIGDINTSPWSPAFKSLKTKGHLSNSAEGYGYIPSWARYSTNN